MKLLLSIAIILSPLFGSAQYLTGVGTKWSDDFRDWIIYTDDEDLEGNLTMRWQMRNDWSEWDYRIGEATGSIQLKFRNDWNVWEIRGDNEIITARTLWKDDPREWRITDNEVTLNLKSRWSNRLDEWSLKKNTKGHFEVYTAWEMDPREWVVVDDLQEDISLPMKIAIVFISIIQSAPR